MKLIKERKSKLVDWELYEALPGVYAVKVEDPYQRGMLFVRYQEHYESPYNQFQGKNFNLFEFMDHYRKDRNAKAFLYPAEWCGYNIPSTSLLKCFFNAEDSNPYDHEMGLIIGAISNDLISEDSRKSKFYLIGVDKVEGGVMDHEIAHALFFLNSKYRKTATDLVQKMPKKKLDKMKKIILDLGYREKVLIDEIQAFMSTGLWDEMGKVVNEKDQLPFINNFRNFVPRLENSSPVLIA